MSSKPICVSGLHFASASRSPTMNSRSRNALSLLAFVAVTFAVAGIGGGATTPAIRSGWYGSLRKPAWTPPDAVFGPVWALLYTLMAVAAWRVWRKCGLSGAHAWWTFQLVLNLGWSLLFFGARRPCLALAELVLLWLAISATIVSFRAADRRASALLLPYLAWTSFALALNVAIVRQNPKLG